MRMADSSPNWPSCAPRGYWRMGADPHANVEVVLSDLRMPDFHVHAVNVPSPVAVRRADRPIRG